MTTKLAELPYKIINVVQSNIRYLLKNPKQLSWCLFCYDLLHTAVRRTTGEYTNNPKYIFIDDPENDWPGLTPEELDFLYEAWGVTVSNDIPNDQCFGAIPKANMTLDEWIELKLNNEYEYKSLYNTKYDVINTLLCVNGTGMGWNKDGFISDGTDGVDEVFFYGYSQAEKDVDPKIRAKIKRICNTVKIKTWFDILYNTAVEFNQLTGSQKSKLRDEILYRKDRVNLDEDPSYFLKAVRNAKEGIFNRKKDSIDKLLEELKLVGNKYSEDLSKFKPYESEQSKFSKEGRFFYPFSKGYCNMDKMPDNAHPSYIKESMRISRLVIEGKAVTCGDKHNEISPANKSMIEVSKAVIAKWEPLGY